ncbi:MAG: F0F1 ATP synthase subunit delta [Gammaproteobacteria bacterium]|nr:F0F1 ATP synthase subunit delta [Gammaproteobacteria bacterium]
MAEKQTLARPYAEAVFELAKAQNSLASWSEMLALLAAVAADENIQRLAGDPRIDRARFLDLFLDIGAKNINAEGANFVRLLVENYRLLLLPEIVTQFETLKAEAEARVDATVTSAFALDEAQLKLLSVALKRKFGREVKLTAQTDKSLVGGIVIRAGDVVIDGSVRGRLSELATHLSH